jgi:hypothetical protein
MGLATGTLFAGMSTIGCGLGGPSLPASLTLELPDGDTLVAQIGSGPASLANSEWAFFRGPSASGVQFVRLVFDEDGGIESFEENTIAPEIFGSRIILDGQRHNTTQQGLTYVAGVYGAETESGDGIAFEVRLKGFAAGIEAATGSASASATFTDEDRNEMTGTFAFTTAVTITDIPGGNQSDEFEFTAKRIEAVPGG